MNRSNTGKVAQTAILAAGMGERIGSGDHGVPKPLMNVAGRPLIDYALEQAVAAGCEEAMIVLGSAGDMVRAHLEKVMMPIRISMVFNPDYEHPNGVSLLAVEPLVRGPFFLQMVDHVFAEPVLKRLAVDPAPSECMKLLVDRDPAFFDGDDATKVRLHNGLIMAIGKEEKDWNAVDAGYFLLDRRVFDALREAAKLEPPSISAGMGILIRSGALAGVELENVPWVDVDTPRDRRWAESMLAAAAASANQPRDE